MILLAGLQPFDPLGLLLIALFNPVVIAVAFLMGRMADQWQKIIVAGFAAACAGAVVVWLATFVRLVPARGAGGEAGLFVMSFVYGVVIAGLAYRFLGRGASR